MSELTIGGFRVALEQEALPYEVRLLLPREREIASIVYARHSATAKDVEAALSDPLTNAAVRSMLNRLTAKGILRRTQSGREFVYLPALNCADSRARALRRFAEDYFGGSMAQAAATITNLLEDRRDRHWRPDAAG